MADIDLNDCREADNEEEGDSPDAYDLTDAMIDDADLPEESSGGHLAHQQTLNAAADLAEHRAFLARAAHSDASAASGQSDRSVDTDAHSSDDGFLDDRPVNNSRARKRLLRDFPSSSDEDQAAPVLCWGEFRGGRGGFSLVWVG